MDILNMISWSDILVVLIIGIATIIGYKTGFILTMYRFVSMLFSIYIAIKLYPLLTKLLVGTPIYTGLKKIVFENVQEKLEGVKKITIEKAVEELNVPAMLNEWILKDNSAVSGNAAVKKISDAISGSLAEIVIKILSVLLVFILIFLILLAVRGLLKILVKLPVIKQIDKTAGLLTGVVTGLILAYIVCAIVVVCGISVSPGAREDIDKSFIAKYFVKNNYIVSTLAKK